MGGFEKITGPSSSKGQLVSPLAISLKDLSALGNGSPGISAEQKNMPQGAGNSPRRALSNVSVFLCRQQIECSRKQLCMNQVSPHCVILDFDVQDFEPLPEYLSYLELS